MTPEIIGYRLLTICCIGGVLLPPVLSYYSARQWRVSLIHWFIALALIAAGLFIALTDLRRWTMIPASMWAGTVLLTLMAFVLSTWMTQNFLKGLAPLARDARRVGQLPSTHNNQNEIASLKKEKS